MASGHADAPRLLLLHGSLGSGKTHLLHSITCAIRDRDPSMAIVETSAMDLVQDMTAALRHGKAADLEQLWPQGAMVTIDDLHVLTGMTATQREVGRLFVAAVEGGRRTGTRSVRDAQEASDRNVLVQLCPVDAETITDELPVRSLFDRGGK